MYFIYADDEDGERALDLKLISTKGSFSGAGRNNDCSMCCWREQDDKWMWMGPDSCSILNRVIIRCNLGAKNSYLTNKIEQDFCSLKN